MLGQARLRQADDFLQFADALFAPGQFAYNEQAVGIAHRLEDRTRLLNVAVDRFQVKTPPFTCRIFRIYSLTKAALDLNKAP